MSAGPQLEVMEEELLGKGATGKVCLGRWQGETVAVKIVQLNTIDNEVTRYLLACEIAALNALKQHLMQDPTLHVVRLLDTILRDNRLYLVTELLEGSLRKKFEQGIFSEQEALETARALLQGYRVMKDCGIVHRDLKPQNVMFQATTGRLAIIDFGYCMVQEVKNTPECYYNVGSPKYMAPEAYRGGNYSEKSDMWSIGIILYEAILGYSPSYNSIEEEYFNNLFQNKHIDFPSLPPPFDTLLSSLLQFDPLCRVTVQGALQILQNSSPKLNQTQLTAVNNIQGQTSFIASQMFQDDSLSKANSQYFALRLPLSPTRCALNRSEIFQSKMDIEKIGPRKLGTSIRQSLPTDSSGCKDWVPFKSDVSMISSLQTPQIVTNILPFSTRHLPFTDGQRRSSYKLTFKHHIDNPYFKSQINNLNQKNQRQLNFINQRQQYSRQKSFFQQRDLFQQKEHVNRMNNAPQRNFSQPYEAFPMRQPQVCFPPQTLHFRQQANNLLFHQGNYNPIGLQQSHIDSMSPQIVRHNAMNFTHFKVTSPMKKQTFIVGRKAPRIVFNQQIAVRS